MSNINYKLLIEDILKILKEHKEIILEEHYVELIRLINFIKEYVNVSQVKSKYGCHYTNCCWSFDACTIGPDTCACFYLERKLIRAKKLLLLYKRLK